MMRAFLSGLIFYTSILSNVANGARVSPPTATRFMNDHVVSPSQFNQLGTNPANWNQLALQRGLVNKPSNTFIVGNYEGIRSSLWRGGSVTYPTNNNIFQSADGFRSIHLERTPGQQDLNSFAIKPKEPFRAGMEITGRNGKQAVGDAIHFEGANPAREREIRTPMGGGPSEIYYPLPQSNTVYYGGGGGTTRFLGVQNGEATRVNHNKEWRNAFRNARRKMEVGGNGGGPPNNRAP